MENKYCAFVTEAISDGIVHKSKLTNEILSIDGMSSSKVRHFLNNLICNMNNARYLEVGIWKGSTFVSALYNNSYEYATGIDNFSEFGSPKDECLNNLRFFLNAPNEKTEFIIDDFEKIHLNKKFNIYFYDGNHSEESQIKAFEIVNENLDDIFITIVDDWNHQRVKDGTKKAFSILNYSVIKEWHLHADKNGDLVNWWNGLYIAVIKKQKNETK